MEQELLVTNIGYIVSLVLSGAIIGIVAAFGRYKSSRLFALCTASVWLWIFCNFLVTNLEDADLVMLFIQLALVGPLFIGPLFLMFARVFPNQDEKVTTKSFFLSIIPALVFLPFTFTKYNVKSVTLGESVSVDFVPGTMYLVFFVQLSIHVLLISGVLLRKYVKSSRLVKKQIQFIAIGFTLTIFIAIISTLITPILGYTEGGVIGPLSTLIFLGSTTYTLLKYQLFDIRVIVGRIIYYMVMGTIFMAAYFFVYFYDSTVFGSSEALGAILTGPINAVIFAIFFIKFNDYIRTQVRSRIINPGYDPLEVNGKLSRDIARMLDINEIGDTALDSINQTIRPASASIAVLGEKGKYVLIDSGKNRVEIGTSDLAIFRNLWEKVGRATINYHELELEIPRVFIPASKEIDDILALMKKYRIRLIVPLKQSDENVGMLILGQKEADSPYTIQDVQFIQGIASTVGLAVTRSLYYLEVQDLNKNLQKKVDEATHELQHKNTKLENALEKIEEIRRQERDMIDVMGHELRTPITIVRNALLVLESKLNKPGQMPEKSVIEYVGKAIESARREVNLVETLLSATKVESNRIQLTLTKIDMVDVVLDGIDGHGTYAKDKGIKIRFEKPKKEIPGYADRTRIQEVMDNFLSNAVKYTLRGEVFISIEETDKTVAISIRDTGIGIAKEDIKHLGKKFFRAKQYLDNGDDDADKVVRPGGTGLGLFVSFNLIRLMNGKVKVESKVGEGSTFTFSVPLFKGQEDKHIDQTFEE